jgi:hypothetical protein
MSNSYYLSSHHIDICCWILQGKAVPTRVVASAAAGIATGEPYNCVPQTEDTITLLVDWQSLTSPRHRGTAVYTASWTAPQNSGVHSAQHFYYMAEKVRIPSRPPPSPPPVSNPDWNEEADLAYVSGRNKCRPGPPRIRRYSGRDRKNVVQPILVSRIFLTILGDT